MFCGSSMPVPVSLAEINGTMRTGNKSILVDVLSFDREHKVSGVPGNLAPPKYGPPGPNFLGNMAPPGAIFPRKFGPRFGNLAPLYKHGC